MPPAEADKAPAPTTPHTAGPVSSTPPHAPEASGAEQEGAAARGDGSSQGQEERAGVPGDASGSSDAGSDVAAFFESIGVPPLEDGDSDEEAFPAGDSGAASEPVHADAMRITGFAESLPHTVEYVELPPSLAALVRQASSRILAEERKLVSCTFDGFAAHLRTCHNVVVMCGAGISCAAGIPDFRSPNGLYAQLGADNPFSLPQPEALFDIHFFRKQPHAFFRFCEKLWPGRHRPTAVHRALRALQNAGCLRRVYTQNIDGLERQAGVDPDKLIEAHGNMESAHCVDCGAPFPASFVEAMISQDRVPLCRACVPGDTVLPLLRPGDPPVRPGGEAGGGDGSTSWSDLPDIRGLVKPRITFFHESLPDDFTCGAPVDLGAADALIIIGTSLTVAPFCRLPEMASVRCPRLLINNVVDSVAGRAGFALSDQFCYRDIVWGGDCQEGLLSLLESAGFPMPSPPAEPAPDSDGGTAGPHAGDKRPVPE